MKYIVVVGGVLSGIGKGIATASIGRILNQYGYKTTAIKIDPYINLDAGTLRPTEHGEVWVTDDGGEIDQDLGSYERFLGYEIPKINNITTGQIYKAVIEKERNGEYLGKTVQFIPHIPDEIKRRIRNAASGYDICIIEIGGTIGDYENIPFLFAMKSIEREEGKDNVIYVLLTYLPVPTHIQEMKTKPTQQAIKMLSEHGIFPDIILCRAHVPLDEVRKKKIEVYANIDADYVISAPDVSSVFEVPLNFEKENLGIKILQKLSLIPRKQPDWSLWERLVKNILNPQKVVDIAMIGKYVDIGKFTLVDSYLSVNQALEHAGANCNVKLNINWIDSNKLEDISILKKFKGIVVPGGFGHSGIEGKILAIKYARENNVPFLGLCLGLQLAVIEFSRNVLNLNNANSTEFDERTEYPVVTLLPKQKEILENRRFGASMRLGAYVAQMNNSYTLNLYKQTNRIEKDKERVKKLENFRIGKVDLNKDFVIERHRHRYEINPKYLDKFESRGFKVAGYHISFEDEFLTEFMEISEHRFFIATQSHPEFKSSLPEPSPVFLGFASEVLKYDEENPDK